MTIQSTISLSELIGEIEKAVKSDMSGWLELSEAVPIELLIKRTLQYPLAQGGSASVDRVKEARILVNYIRNIYFTPNWMAKFLTIEAEMHSPSGKGYMPTIRVFNMKIDSEFAPETPLKAVDYKSGEEFYFRFIHPNDNVAVGCQCSDFVNRFAFLLKKDRSLAGKFIPVKPTSTKPRKSQNVADVAGACKHIIAVIMWMEKVGILTRKTKSNNEIDVYELEW
jgi:hypothetical protein